jgi:hypothetical protein
MKKTLIAFIALNILLVAVVAGLLLLAKMCPFQPGDPFYSVQHLAEQGRLRLAAGKTRQADIALDLAERRLADLAQADSPTRISAAVIALDQALDESVRRVDATPSVARDESFERLRKLLTQAEIVVAALELTEDDTTGSDAVAALASKIAALQEANTSEEMADLVPPPPPTLLGAIPIPFLSQDVDHDFYALTGGHTEPECDDCHKDGQYADTSTECASCHDLLPDSLYPDHFAGKCDDCHDIESGDWAFTTRAPGDFAWSECWTPQLVDGEGHRGD